MSTPPRQSAAYSPQSKLDDLEPMERLERLVLRVHSLERWARTLSAQNEEWLSEMGRFAIQLDLAADRLAKFSDDLTGLDLSPDFDREIPF